LAHSDVLAQISEIASEHFETPGLQLKRETVASDVDGWDSVSNIQFLLCVEQEFNVTFRASEITGLANVGELVDLVNKRMGTQHGCVIRHKLQTRAIRSSNMLSRLRFHHHGLALKHEHAALSFLRMLGYDSGTIVYDPLQNVQARMCTHVTAPAVELVLPGKDDGPLTRLLTKHEHMLYHTCYEVADRDETVKSIEETGLRVIEVARPLPAILFHGRKVSFHNVLGFGLIELLDMQ
jgi:acyl carrier protein